MALGNLNCRKDKNALVRGLLVYAHEGIERGAEVVAQTKDIRELVAENIDRDREKYGVFGKNREDYRILQQYIRLQKIKNPNNTVTGIGAEHPNLKLLAQEKFDRTEAIKANERVRKHLDGLRRNASAAREGLEPKEFDFNKDYSATVTEINKALNARNQKRLEEVKTDELESEGYKKIFNIFPNGIARGKFEAEDLTFTETTIAGLSEKIKTLQNNSEKMEGDAINTLKSGTQPKMYGNAGEYRNLILNQQIPYLQKHLNFLKQAQVYLKAYESVADYKKAAAKARKEREMGNYAALVVRQKEFSDEALRTKIEGNNKEIQRLESERATATSEDNAGEMARIKAQIAGLKEQNKILGYRQEGALGAVTERNREIIDASQKNPSENVLMAMDMFVAVREEIGKKNKLPKDKETYAFVMVTAMLNGAENIDNIFPELSRDYEIREKKAAYTYGKLLKGKRFTPESGFAEFLKDGYPNPSALAEFRLAAEEAKIAKLREQIKFHFNEAGGVLNGYELFNQKARGAEGVPEVDAEAINAQLEELKDQARQLIAALNDYALFNEDPELNSAQIMALEVRLEALENVKPIPPASVAEWIPLFGGFSEEQKAEIAGSYRALELASQAFKPETPINQAKFAEKLEGSVIYKMLNTSSQAGNKELAERIKKGETELIETILGDIDNNFVDKRNEEQISKIAEALKLSREEFETLYRDIQVAELEEMSHFERLAKLNGITHEGLFSAYYYEAKAWQKPKTRAANWEKDLESKLPENGAESHAYKILSNIMGASPDNNKFLEDLINPENTGHQDAREMLKAIVDELETLTNHANNDLKAQIDFEKGYYEKGETITERAGGIGRHVFDRIFGPGVKPEIRLIYGFMAYWVISKGLKGDGWTGKGIRGAAIALGLGMVVEDTTGKAALKFLGIDSPAEIGRGSWLTTEAEKSNIEETDDAGYKALDILKGKKVEDVLDWYQNRGDYGQTDLDKAKNRGQNNFESLIRSGLLTRGELQSIMPDEENKERVASKFLEVVKLQLERWGKRVSGNTLGSREEYIDAGIDDLYLHFTADGFRKNAENGGILYLSKAKAEQLKGGAYKWNWKEATQVLQTAEDWDEANLDVGLAGLWRTFKNEMDIYKTKALPHWLEIKGLGKYMTDEAIKAFYEDYGPATWDTMKEWGDKGYKFTIEKKDEIQIWWKEAETPLTIKKIAENTWVITKTGIAAPFAASIEAGKRVTGSMVDHIRKFDMDVRKWTENEHLISFEMFPDESGRWDMGPEAKENLKNYRFDRLRLNFVANGYEIFGKYEQDWARPMPLTEDGTEAIGMLARPNLRGDIMQRFDFRVEEGYINFMSLEPSIDKPLSNTRQKAYRRAVKELEEFLLSNDPDGGKFIDQLNPSDEFTQAIKSRNAAEIRKHVEPFIQKYGSYYSERSGYMLMLRVPVPLNDKYRATTEYVHEDRFLLAERLEKLEKLQKDGNKSAKKLLEYAKLSRTDALKKIKEFQKKIKAARAAYNEKELAEANAGLKEILTARGAIVKKVKHNTEYYERKTDRWKFGELNEYKKNIIFSIDDAVIENYIQAVEADDRWTQEYMKSFMVWEPLDRYSLDVYDLLNYTRGSIENVEIKDYRKGDNLRERFFNELKREYKNKWFARLHWSRQYETMHKDLQYKFSATPKIAADFKKYHSFIEEEVENLSWYKTLREKYDEDFIERGYRQYLAEKLTAAYRAKNHGMGEVPKKNGKPVPESDWVEYFTIDPNEGFIYNEAVSIPEAALLGIGKGAYTLADAISKKAYTYILTQQQQAKKQASRVQGGGGRRGGGGGTPPAKPSIGATPPAPGTPPSTPPSTP